MTSKRYLPQPGTESLDAALSAGLTDTQRRYLTHYYIDRLPMRRIAELCGVNVSTVSRTISRASSRLKRAENISRLLHRVQ